MFIIIFSILTYFNSYKIYIFDVVKHNSLGVKDTTSLTCKEYLSLLSSLGNYCLLYYINV